MERRAAERGQRELVQASSQSVRCRVASALFTPGSARRAPFLQSRKVAPHGLSWFHNAPPMDWNSSQDVLGPQPCVACCPGGRSWGRSGLQAQHEGIACRLHVIVLEQLASSRAVQKPCPPPHPPHLEGSGDPDAQLPAAGSRHLLARELTDSWLLSAQHITRKLLRKRHTKSKNKCFNFEFGQQSTSAQTLNLHTAVRILGDLVLCEAGAAPYRTW